MRRWEYVEWKQEFNIDGVGSGSADRELVIKLTTQSELEGLLVMLVRAARKILELHRLSRERTINEVREEWVRRSDVTLAFFKATIEPDPEGLIPKEQLLAEYAGYCRIHNYTPKGATSLWKKLRDNYAVTEQRPKIDGERVRCWRGIKRINLQRALL
jgi:phage/plasmid-associated DNA primase